MTLSKINHDLNKMTAAETEDIIGFVFCPPGWDESRLTSGEDSAMITTIANETYTDIAFIKEKNAIQIIGETHDDVYKAQNRLNSLFFPVAQKSKRAWTRPDKPGAWGQSRRSSTNLRRMASVSHMGEQEPSSNYRASGSWN